MDDWNIKPKGVKECELCEEARDRPRVQLYYRITNFGDKSNSNTKIIIHKIIEECVN